MLTKEYVDDAGWDIYSKEGAEWKVEFGDVTAIPTGLHVEIPRGCVGLVCDRSGLGKRGFKVLGGVIDAGYTGEVKVLMGCMARGEVLQSAGERIKVAQLLVLPLSSVVLGGVLQVGSARGAAGFGSTGLGWGSDKSGMATVGSVLGEGK